MADERNSADCRNWMSSGSKWPFWDIDPSDWRIGVSHGGHGLLPAIKSHRVARWARRSNVRYAVGSSLWYLETP